MPEKWCLVKDCQNKTTREPQFCTKHFIEGYGRIPGYPEFKPQPIAPEEKAADTIEIATPSSPKPIQKAKPVVKSKSK